MKILTLLAAIAGWVDAVGFVLLPHVFPSFMSGNNTSLMVELNHGNLGTFIIYASVILAFLSGVVIGGIITNSNSQKSKVLAFMVEAMMLWLAMLSVVLHYPVPITIVLLALSMGIHNFALRKGDKLQIKTYISGTLVSLGHGISHGICRGEWSNCIFPARYWLSFLIGAGAGALIAIQTSPLLGILIPALLITSFCFAELFIFFKMKNK